MLIPEFNTPPTQKNNFFDFTRTKKVEDGEELSAFRPIDPGLVSTEIDSSTLCATTLKMGDGPVRMATRCEQSLRDRRVAPSINHASKRINREARTSH